MKKNTIDSFILILLEAFTFLSYCDFYLFIYLLLLLLFFISNERVLLAKDWDSKEFS